MQVVTFMCEQESMYVYKVVVMLSLLLPLTMYNWMRIYFYTHIYCYIGEIIDGHLLAPHTHTHNTH